jgi:ABC-type glycerol-3-phosphate transport system substrate-binding protein
MYSMKGNFMKNIWISAALMVATTIGLGACGGGGGSTAASLENSCEKMAKMAGETPPKGACKCMSKELTKNLSKEDATTLAKAFSSMDKPEDALTAMLPLMANGNIMKAMKNIESVCDIK